MLYIISEMKLLDETEVNQQYGGLRHKPTFLGTNLSFEPKRMAVEKQKFLRKHCEGAREG